MICHLLRLITPYAACCFVIRLHLPSRFFHFDADYCRHYAATLTLPLSLLLPLRHGARDYDAAADA